MNSEMSLPVRLTSNLNQIFRLTFRKKIDKTDWKLLGCRFLRPLVSFGFLVPAADAAAAAAAVVPPFALFFPVVRRLFAAVGFEGGDELLTWSSTVPCCS